jgi:hypothetical protein
VPRAGATTRWRNVATRGAKLWNPQIHEKNQQKIGGKLRVAQRKQGLSSYKNSSKERP